jgi:hypothetical protein
MNKTTIDARDPAAMRLFAYCPGDHDLAETHASIIAPLSISPKRLAVIPPELAEEAAQALQLADF